MSQAQCRDATRSMYVILTPFATMVQTRSQTKSPSPERPSKRIKHEDEKDDQEKLHESSAKDRQHSAKQDQEDIESDVKQENEGLPHDSSSHGENVTSGSLPPETFGGFTHERTNGLLEKGHLYFVYRPKVEHDHAESLDDVARFYLSLQAVQSDIDHPGTGSSSCSSRVRAKKVFFTARSLLAGSTCQIQSVTKSFGEVSSSSETTLTSCATGSGRRRTKPKPKVACFWRCPVVVLAKTTPQGNVTSARHALQAAAATSSTALTMRPKTAKTCRKSTRRIWLTILRSRRRCALASYAF